MNPNLEGIIASPISSFSLTTRPMILAPSDVLELRISSEHRKAGLTLDGQIMVELEDTDTVIVSKADFKMKFITFGQKSFYRLVKNKLHWGLSPRG
jgi:NAD+ kinase